MKNWKKYRLSDFMEINPKVPLKSGNIYSFVEMKDLSEDQRSVFPSQGKELKGGARFHNGDTLFARITPCLENGKISQVKGLRDNVGFGSTEFLVFRGKDSISITDFVYYLSRYQVVRSFAEQNMVGTSGRQRVSKEAFQEIVLELPPLTTQTAIAEILSSLDDKIELNNEINKNLEAMAQALFKHWFVNFEFPNENGQPYKSLGGEMVKSELGMIPKGWRVDNVKNEFKINMGQSPKGETYNIEGNGMIFFQGRSDFGFRFPSVRMYTTEPKKIAEKNDTLISVRAPVGDINMAQTKCCIGRGLGAISHPEGLYSYTYYKILSIQENLRSFDNEGTVFGSINKDTLGNIKTLVSPDALPNAFNDLVLANDQLIYNLSTETSELVKLRDTLLPKLISGELEVKNTEKVIANV